MIQDAKNRPISELFDIESKVTYFIPRYQRRYTWGKTQWEALFDDIWENAPGYFLGSIICINQTADALSIQELEIVDGQQRFATISLLFAAIYSKLKQLETEMDEEATHDLYNLKCKLVLKRADDKIRLTPQIENSNQNDYFAVLSEIGVISSTEIPLNAGNRKIFHAFRYFQNRLEQITNGHNNQLEAISQLLDKVNRASMVKIEVASHADAYTLFESLNNRGIPLTVIDLIKNKLLARLESDEPGKVDNYYNQWKNFLEYLSDDYSIQERFFRHYYNAFKDELNEPFRTKDDKKVDPLGSIATRSNLISIYEKLINNNAKECLDKLIISGKLYARFLSRNNGTETDELNLALKDLERIQGAPAYLLLLYLSLKNEQLGLDDGHLVEIVKFLVRFFVRRNLTDTPPTRDLTRLFMAIIAKLEQKVGQDIVSLIKEQLIAVSADDKTFREKLEGSIYEDNVGVTRFILCTIAEQAMTRETKIDLWKYEGKQLVWTIEHIFPQGENIPSFWVNMIANGDAEKAKKYQETHVHKLGNLTISGYNSKLGNKSFKDKRDRTDSKGRAVGYNNGLILNEDLITKADWSISKIDERTEKLVKQTIDLFSF